MVDSADLLHCPSCGTFYKPRKTETGRYIPHCLTTIKPERGELMWMDGEVHVDFAALEARALARMGLTDVVDPPLTVPRWRFHLFGLSAYEIILLIALAVFLVWVDATPANGACLMSYCHDKAPTRSYITNIYRQKVGDLYTPVLGQRTQIRDTSRRIIGYIEVDGTITNTHRQKKGRIND